MTATVVTGLGVAAPTGLGLASYWSATLAGQLGIRRITRFDPSSYPARLAGEITGFAAAEHLPSRLLPQTDRMTQIALASADWAFADAGVTPSELADYAAGVITASHSGGFEFGQNELQALWSKGGQHVSAYQSFAWFYAVNSGQISIRNGLRGPSSVLVSDQAGGLDAVAHARRQVRAGTALVISGAIDASICPWGWVAQLADRIGNGLFAPGAQEHPVPLAGQQPRRSEPDAAGGPGDQRRPFVLSHAFCLVSRCTGVFQAGRAPSASCLLTRLSRACGVVASATASSSSSTPYSRLIRLLVSSRASDS
jgi:hypothetical protein